MYRKQLKDLTIRDSFLFTAVMSEEANCKPFLEMLLGIEIQRIEVSYEKSFIHNPQYKGIRLDVYASDENNTRYDIELQVAGQNLGKRVRYYHGEMDRDLLRAGHPYEELPDTYVIFICNFDPFGKGKYCYVFENRCLEEPGLSMGDGARSIFLNTTGNNPEDISEDLRGFLDFIRQDTPATDTVPATTYVKQLQESVRRVKQDGERERQYMYIWDLTRDVELNTKRESILELLEDHGTISEELKNRILSEVNSARLKAMHKAAAKAPSLSWFEDFITNL